MRNFLSFEVKCLTLVIKLDVHWTMKKWTYLCMNYIKIYNRKRKN